MEGISPQVSKKYWSLDRRTSRGIRDRLTLLAYERPQIGKVEIRNAMKNEEALLAFARRHEVCLDRLIRGRLKGLLFMAEWARLPGVYAVGRDQ
jgi:hypothetical protein